MFTTSKVNRLVISSLKRQQCVHKPAFLQQNNSSFDNNTLLFCIPKRFISLHHFTNPSNVTPRANNRGDSWRALTYSPGTAWDYKTKYGEKKVCHHAVDEVLRFHPTSSPRIRSKKQEKWHKYSSQNHASQVPY